MLILLKLDSSKHVFIYLCESSREQTDKITGLSARRGKGRLRVKTEYVLLLSRQCGKERLAKDRNRQFLW